ncbi:MAG TPA: FAD-dependent oxidoreductase [Candidatus Binatia bacterium]|nr:FAD-dependent oxidoreductase [Candidatus Binatia bacterium]
MRTQARVAVIGGGAVGASLLYHLALRGWTDTVLLEKDELTNGSTWHAAGLCTQFNASLNVTSLLMRSVALFKRLETETGMAVDFREVGSLRLATTKDRLDQYLDAQGLARVAGLPFEIVGADEVKRRAPLVDTDGILAAAWTPTDGYVDPTAVTLAMAEGARRLGGEIARQTPVLELRQVPGGEWDVVTPAGTIRAEIVVNAAGIWGRDVGRLAGVDLPIVPIEHQYLVTDAIPELGQEHAEMPVVRDVEASFYVREEGGGLLVGPYEREPKPWSERGIPGTWGRQLLPSDFDQVSEILDLARRRIPALETAGMKQLLNGPTSYTPDGNALMGWVPGRRNLFVLSGFSYGIVQSGGAGYNAAAWIVEGGPDDNLWELDVQRFGPHAAALEHLVPRARETYEREYAIPFPFLELPAGRPLKTDPLYDRLAARGAVFGARNGWERPLYFAPGAPGAPSRDRADDAATAADAPSYRTPGWLPYQREESLAVRERAGLLDMTSFAKFEVSGPGAAAFLDRLCANRLPAVGRIALTQVLNRAGGIDCDLTLTRLAEDRFYVVTAAATETHDLDRFVRNAPEDGSVRIDNVTCAWGVLMLAGPRARDILAPLTDADLSSAAFPFMAAREILVGPVPVRALRATYTGELGWELHHPMEYSRTLYDLLTAAGEEAGLADIGYRALESLRLEKGYRLWGADIGPLDTPLEAGLERFVVFDKGDFLGRDALLRQQGAGVRRRLACLTIDLRPDDDLFPRGGEPVFDGADLVGYLRAAHPGHTVGRTIGLAYLPPDRAVASAALEVEVLGQRRPATVAEAPLYDPEGARMRS